jgi:O-antigen/teichoic acid export membrane protein
MSATRPVRSIYRLAGGFRRFVATSHLLRGIGRDISWIGGGAICSRLLGLVTTIYIARWLGIDGFGRYGMILATLGTLGVFAGAGLGITATKFVAEADVKNAQQPGQILGLVFLCSIITGIAISGAAFLLGPWLSTQVLADPSLEFPLRISSALILFNTLNGVQLGALAGLQAFKAMAAASLSAAVITALFSVTGAYTGGLVGACIGVTVAAAAYCLVGHAILRAQMQRKNIRLSFSGVLRSRNILLSFSLPSLLSGLLVDPVNWLCAAMVVNQSGDYHQMGAYYAANQWMTALLFLPGLVANVVFPRLSRAFAQQGRDHALTIMVFSIGINAAVTVPLALVLSFGSGSIMRLYGPALSSEWPILVFTLIAAALMAIASPVGGVIAASGRMWVGMALNVAWAASFILLTILLLPHAAIGLAIARAIAYGLHVGWSSGCAVWLVRLLPRIHIEKPGLLLSGEKDRPKLGS